MRCTHCGWTNPAGFTHCHHCRKVLTPADGRAAAPGVSHASGEVFAGEGARIVATLVDLCLLAALLPLLLYGGLYLAGALQLGGGTLFGLLATLALLAIASTAVLDSWTRGSPGKRFARIRVVDAGGDAPGLGRSILRTLAKYALHPLLSLPVLVLERLAFGRHSLHNLMTGSYVVSAKASREAIRYRIGRDAGSARFLRLARRIGVLLVVAIVALAALLGYAAVTAQPNPRRDAARAAVAAANEAARRVGDSWQATGSFPSQWNEAPAPVLESLRIDASSGTLTATANDPRIAGARIVLTPEIASKNERRRIRSWRCTSPDLSARELPLRCRSTKHDAAD